MNQSAHRCHCARTVRSRLLLLLAAIVSASWIASPPSAAAPAPVTLREVDEVIPTYLSGLPDPNPMFYFGRESQGAEGRIYPYPLNCNLTNQKSDVSYRMVYLENEYVRIGIAPELGGRLFSALDKTNNYNYVYRQHVIKPALIGLTGAWISGGIEWNIPHHHRASTFSPVQYRTVENADGSKTVWVGELEIRHRMRWAVGYTLRPGSNVLECSVRIVNRTPVANTMLCFANVAVNTNDNYQIIFPPSTQWVTHHAKREFSTWPIATQPYGGVNWNKVDVSWYKNHQTANSMFAWNYTDDFYAGYDHGREAGIMSVADHHVVPGKKFWTWGNGSRGRMWDEILTDNDGPYIELMVGAYSDNQPDYSWLQPFETRAFTMNWYPFREIGGVKNANLDAAVNLEVKDGVAQFGFCTTRAFATATARLTAGATVLIEEAISIDPAKPYAKQAAIPAGVDARDLRESLWSDGRELVGYTPVRLMPVAQPAVVTPPPPPAEIKNNEELFLAGQRIDQFHNPYLDSDPYWEEVLRRDPGDIEANTGMGRLDLRRARFASAVQHFRKALERLTAKYTTPKNAEPLYYLGVALKGQGLNDQAFDAFYKAAWSQEWKAPAYFALAEISTARGDFSAALDFADRSLDANALNVRAYGLKAAVLRHLNRTQEALGLLAVAAARTDPLDVGLMAEQWLATRDAAAAATLFGTLNRHHSTAQEIAAEFTDAGLWRDAVDVLAESVATAPDKEKIAPMVYYDLGDLSEKLGDAAKAADYRSAAAAASPEYVFPFQSEAIAVLRGAIQANPKDARAPYYLGNLLFDWQPDEAVALWEKSVALDPTFPIAWRNLAQAYSHRPGGESLARAIAALEKAIAVPNPDPTHLAELDSLYAAAGAPVEKRLALLEAHQPALLRHDECLAHLIGLKTFAGKTDESIDLLASHTFNIWEGGTRFSTADSWINAHLARGQEHFQAGKYRDALADFEAATRFPANLRAYDTGARTAEISYWVGCAQEALGNAAQSTEAWNRAAAATFGAGRRGDAEIVGEDFRRARQRYHQALALRKLGQNSMAESVFRDLASPPASTPAMSAAAKHYAAGLGCAGLGEKEKARIELTAALAAVPDSLDAKLALGQL